MKLQLLALMLLFGAIRQNPNEGTIEGRVLRTGTGEPLANMPVTLISSGGLSDGALAGLLDQMAQLVTIGLQGGGGGGSQDQTIRQVTSLLQTMGPGVGVQASVLTDRAGHFAFSNVPRGRYTIWVQRFNYFGPLRNGIPSSTVSATIAIDPPRQLPPADLYMTQGMAITGRVLDSRGQPALGMPITAYRPSYSEGKPRWLPILSRQIDDRGEYRLAPLPPGDYYVAVTPPQNALAPAGQNPHVRTLFPGVTEPFEATRLALKNSDATGVDFSIRTAPATFFKISGVALNPAPAPSPTGIVDRGFNSFILVPVDAHVIDSFTPTGFPNFIPVTARGAGEFEIRNVRPGVYELYPDFSAAGFLPGRTLVDVRNSDALGVQVLVNPVARLQGRVVLTETSPQRPVKLDSIRIQLKPVNAMPAGRGAAPFVMASATGDFIVSAPSGASAVVQVAGIPETAFISDIRIGNTSVFDNGFEVAGSTDPLQVVVDPLSGGTVDASVTMPDGRPGARATVVLVPAEDRRQNPMRYKFGTTDEQGHLIVRGIAPGSYTAFAWESIPDSAWQNREFLSRYQQQGTAIMIAPGSQTNLQLKWIPFDSL